MSMRRFRGRRGSRSQFRRWDSHGTTTVSANSTTMVTLVSPGSGDRYAFKRLRASVLVQADVDRQTGWFGFARLPDDAVPYSVNLDDPRLLRPRLFHTSGQNDLIYETFLNAITLDDEDELYLALSNDGAAAQNFYWHVLGYVDYQGGG